jgi:hypothetical protein
MIPLILALLTAPGSIDQLLQGIEHFSYRARSERWGEIDKLVKQDPAAKARLVEIATGKVRIGEYQRFVAAGQLAGFGQPTTCGPTAAAGTPLGLFVGLFKGSPVGNVPRKITYDPGLTYLTLKVPQALGRTTQDTLWDVLQTHRLSFRTEPDGTFHIFREDFL